MQHQWLRWFNGYLMVIIRGKRLERFINLAVQKRIQIWQISRYREDRGKLAIRLEDFFRLKPLLKETGCRVHIISKHGLPFFLTRVRKRYAFFGGFLAFVCMLFVLSNMIWTVEVVGTENISKVDVMQMADDIGIKQGKLTFLLDEPTQIQSKLLERLPEASWVGFQLKGTRAQIRIVEKVLPEEKELASPRNIIARKSAVIHYLFAEHGKPMVRKNDFVKKGDVLVSGLIGKEDEPVAVAATGRVEGEVWYETEVVVPTIRTQNVYTGEKHRNIYIIAGDWEIKVWGYGDLAFAKTEIKGESRILRWRDVYLPLGWKKEDIFSVETNQVKVTRHEAQEIAKDAAKRDILSKMDNNGYIKEEKVLHQRQENDKVYIKMHIIAIEDIAAYEPIILEGD
jgi:similar to stage IV sporulation protein